MPLITFQDEGPAAGGSTGQNWTAREVDAIVTDYFDMLAAELAGQLFSKAAHNDALRQVIGRSRKSIEFKHCNISAVLERLGLPIVSGYRPLRHFQNALVDGVDRYLAAKGGPFLAQTTATAVKVAGPATLWVPEAFRLFRLYNFLKGPAAFELKPPLEGWVTLSPVSYRATF